MFSNINAKDFGITIEIVPDSIPGTFLCGPTINDDPAEPWHQNSVKQG